MVDDAVTQALATSAARSPQRACFLLHVRPEQLEPYLAAHERVWTDMRQALTDCGWQHYSLFVRPEDGLVVGYLETDDFAAAQSRMAATEVNARWQAGMSDFFENPAGVATSAHSRSTSASALRSIIFSSSSACVRSISSLSCSGRLVAWRVARQLLKVSRAADELARAPLSFSCA